MVFLTGALLQSNFLMELVSRLRPSSETLRIRL